MKKLIIIVQLLILMFSLWVPTPGQRIEGPRSRVSFLTACGTVTSCLWTTRRT